jgi:protein-S-isoprenylcysteine O-methyltransferase Ste14
VKLKVYPTHILLIAMTAMPALHLLWPAGTIIPAPWTLLGLIPIAAGILINLAADGALHRVGTTVKPFEESAALVTGGAYRISRHPMYLGFVLILGGVAILLGSPTPWIVVPLFVVWIDRVFITAEERMLSSRFGPAWKEYASRARRWI